MQVFTSAANRGEESEKHRLENTVWNPQVRSREQEASMISPITIAQMACQRAIFSAGRSCNEMSESPAAQSHGSIVHHSNDPWPEQDSKTQGRFWKTIARISDDPTRNSNSETVRPKMSALIEAQSRSNRYTIDKQQTLSLGSTYFHNMLCENCHVILSILSQDEV